MSGKPTYAAVINSPADSNPNANTQAKSTDGGLSVTGGASNNGSGSGAGASASGDAPPPYSAPQGQIQPHQTILPPQPHHPNPNQQLYAHAHALESGHAHAHGGWMQNPPAIARSRAIRRFWGAFFWAWMIWVLVGLLIGGGISDVSHTPHNHGHWDKHGDWHDDRGTGSGGKGGVYDPSISALGMAGAEVASSSIGMRSEVGLDSSTILPEEQNQGQDTQEESVVFLPEFL